MQPRTPPQGSRPNPPSLRGGQPLALAQPGLVLRWRRLPAVGLVQAALSQAGGRGRCHSVPPAAPAARHLWVGKWRVAPQPSPCLPLRRVAEGPRTSPNLPLDVRIAPLLGHTTGGNAPSPAAPGCRSVNCQAAGPAPARPSRRANPRASATCPGHLGGHASGDRADASCEKPRHRRARGRAARRPAFRLAGTCTSTARTRAPDLSPSRLRGWPCCPVTELIAAPETRNKKNSRNDHALRAESGGMLDHARPAVDSHPNGAPPNHPPSARWPRLWRCCSDRR